MSIRLKHFFEFFNTHLTANLLIVFVYLRRPMKIRRSTWKDRDLDEVRAYLFMYLFSFCLFQFCGLIVLYRCETTRRKNVNSTKHSDCPRKA